MAIDFEVHPVGTKARIAELEAIIAKLQDDIDELTQFIRTNEWEATEQAQYVILKI
jgi:prefoldin subunit 5